jgi:hypothetical protein
MTGDQGIPGIQGLTPAISGNLVSIRYLIDDNLLGDLIDPLH